MTRAIRVLVWLSILAGCAPELDDNDGADQSRTACRSSPAPQHLDDAANARARTGQALDVVGVATLAASLAPERAGFFLQPSDEDAALFGGEGLFVAWPGAPPAPGTRVRARGTLGETASFAELHAVERLDECGVVAVAPEPIDARALDSPEAYDGRWVRARGDWRVVDVPASPADGRLAASAQGRIFGPGHPLSNADTTALWTLRPNLVGPVQAAAGEPSSPRLGAALGELEGVLSVQGQARHLFMAKAPAWPSEIPAPPPRPSASGLRIVGLNLHNYFVTLGARGARSADELHQQRDALVALFIALDADVLALTELENRGAESLSHLLEGLDRALPGDRRYAFEEAPAPTDGVLRAGIAFRPGRVRARGAAWFSSTPGFRRAPLFQAFESEGLSFTLGVVHLASKRCDDEPVVVPPEGCGEEARRREAELLLEAAHGLQTSAPLEPLLLMGDFNADAREAPLELLASAGYGDLLSTLPAADRYSYVFEGRASLLDHALATAGFSARVSSAAIWHINADEPPSSRGARRGAAPSPRASSDHDPIIIDLQPSGVRPMGL